MKNLKIKLKAFSLLALLIVSVFMTSCEQEAVPAPELPEVVNQEMVVVSSEALSEDDVRVAELKTIVESEVTEMGTPQFDTVTFIQYSKDGTTALILPFTSEDGLKTTTLISYFAEGIHTNSFYLEFSPTEEYLQRADDNVNTAYSGEVALYDKNSEVMVRNTVVEGVEIENYTNPQLRSCMSDCLEAKWNSIAWWKKVACGGSFGACVYSGNIYACSVVAGCVGGMVWYCWNRC